MSELASEIVKLGTVPAMLLAALGWMVKDLRAEKRRSASLTRELREITREFSELQREHAKQVWQFATTLRVWRSRYESTRPQSSAPPPSFERATPPDPPLPPVQPPPAPFRPLPPTRIRRPP